MDDELEVTIAVARGDDAETTADELVAFFDGSTIDIPDDLSVDHREVLPVRRGPVQDAFLTTIAAAAITGATVRQLRSVLNEVAIHFADTSGAPLVRVEVDGRSVAIADLTPGLIDQLLPADG